MYRRWAQPLYFGRNTGWLKHDDHGVSYLDETLRRIRMALYASVKPRLFSVARHLLLTAIDCVLFESSLNNINSTDALCSQGLRTMAEDFKKYLATEILSEQRTLSYRNVSRALKVHVNAAKCMLYDFYGFQNEKKPGSVYATYLLSGVKKRQKTVKDTNGTNGHKHGAYDEDIPIPSSPPPFTSSMLEPSQQSSDATEESEPHVNKGTITLVREEDLEGTDLSARVFIMVEVG